MVELQTLIDKIDKQLMKSPNCTERNYSRRLAYILWTSVLLGDYEVSHRGPPIAEA